MKRLFGNTIFSRILIFNIICVSACIIILGSLQIVLVNGYMSRQSEEALTKNADSIVSLIQNNISRDNLSNILRGFSKSSNSHIMIIDNKGSLLINTHDSGFVQKAPAFLPTENCKSVLDGNRNSVIGTMGGIFNETMFTLQVPITASGGSTAGAVMISIPIPEYQRMNNALFRILMGSILAVILISILLSYILAIRLSKPLKNISNSAKEFAKGNLSARVGDIAVKSDVIEIADLAGNFNEMAFELEKVEEIRNSFISDVSHELRTPMTTISGFVYGMIDDTIPQEKQKEYLKIVYNETTRLSRLVNTFLDISKMQTGRLELHKTNFDINEAIRLTVIGLESRINEKNIKVTLNFESDSCFVYADSDSIKRVITNLLDNAVKFTDEYGEIQVAVNHKMQEVFVSVKNTGCGIPEEQQPLIFERLYKVDKSRSMNREGSGIGLYLVKNIIRSHGKNITVNSVEGEYAEFVFSLEKGKNVHKQDINIDNI